MAMVCRQLYYTSNSRYHGIELCTRRIYTVGDVLLKVLEIDDGWGLVMFRCSYESQEKWDLFLSITKQRIAFHLSEEDDKAAEVIGKLKWAIFENEEELDGASVESTASKFVDWTKNEGAVERGGGGMEDQPWFLDIPRYRYFIHVDTAILDAIHADVGYLDPVEDDDGYQWRGQGQNHMYLIDTHILFQSDWSGDSGMERQVLREWTSEEEDEVEERDAFCKRVKGETMLGLYMGLLQDRPYELLGEGGLFEML